MLILKINALRQVKVRFFFLPTDTNYKLVFTHPKNELCKGIFFNVRFFAGVNPWNYHPQIINPSEELIAAIKDIPKNVNYTTPKKDCGFIIKAYTFLELVQEFIVKSNTRFSELIENAIEYMFNTPKYSITDVAKHCNISERYLSKLFEKTVGISPVKMKQKIKAEKAEDLLKSTNLTIDEIANRGAFTLPHIFERFLKADFIFLPAK